MNAFDNPPGNQLRMGDSLQSGKCTDNPGFVRVKTNGYGGLTIKDLFFHLLKFGIEIG